MIKLENQHNFNELIKIDKMNRDDIERICLFYIIAESQDLFNKIDDIYNFVKRVITPELSLEGKGIYDFTSSSQRLISLAYNLYNGYPGNDILETFCHFNADDYKVAMNAINIRFKMDVLEF